MIAYVEHHDGSSFETMHVSKCRELPSRWNAHILSTALSFSKRLTRIAVTANEVYTTQYEAPNRGIKVLQLAIDLRQHLDR